MPNPNLVAEIQRIMNEPVMNTDLFKLTASAGTMEGVNDHLTIQEVIFPMITGLQAAVVQLAQEVADLPDES